MKTPEKDPEKSWPEEKSPLKSPWLRGIFLLILLFFFSNFVMIWFATDTKPNLVTEDYYERGQSFTERSKLKKRGAKELGWVMKLTTPELKAGKPATISLSISDEDSPAKPDEVSLYIYRPADGTKDFQKKMAANTSGDYEAEAVFQLSGVWDIIAVAKKDEKEADLARRVYVEK